MRKTAFVGTTVLAVSLLLSACGGGDDMAGDQMSDETATEQAPTDDMTDDMGDDMDDDMSMEARTGDFEGLGGKAVSGSVEVSPTEVVLSDFSSDEAPDLHVYLTNGSEEADVDAGMELDAVAFDEASQTFALDGVEPADYDTVVIHCDKAKAVFGAAPLA